MTISTNYLSGLLMDTAGLEKTGYQSWLEKLQQQYPVVTANFYQGTDWHISAVEAMKTR